MKPKLQLFSSSASFGKNNLSLNQFNQNFLELNYQFKIKSLNDSLNLQDQELNKDMEPIDLSIKSNRTSPEIISNLNEKKNCKSNNGNEIDHQLINHVDRSFSSKNIKSLGQNNTKLLPYLLMSNQTKLEKDTTNTDNLEKNLNNFQDVDLLRYNKKKLFLASVRKRKQSSSTDNSNISFYGNNLSFSSSSNSPNSTPPSSSSSTIINSLNSANQDLLKSNKKNNFNPPLSPNSDNHSNEENYLDNYQLVKAKLLNKIQRNQLLNETNLLNEKVLFLKKNSCDFPDEKIECKNYKQINNFEKEIKTSMCKKSNRCNQINLKSSISRCSSENNLLKNNLKIKIFNKNILKKWYSESELFEFKKRNKIEECNSSDEEYLPKKSFILNSNKTENNLLKNSKIETKETLSNNHILKNKYKLLLEKEHLNSQLLNENQSDNFYSKDEELINYTKHLLRANLNQKANYQFCQNKSSNLPLNLQVNNTSLKFSSQMFVNTNQCNKINKKTGKRKFTKLASDEDEDEEEEDDEEENEENIIVDNLPSNDLSFISPETMQSLIENNSIIEKKLLAKHHLEHSNDHHLDQQSEDNGLDLRLPYHSSCLLPNNLQSRRNVQNKSLNSSFGNLPIVHLLQNENSNSSKNLNDDSASLKFYKNYYYLLSNQPDSPAKLDALKWMMKNLNEKNNNHINLNEEWTEQDIFKSNNYADQLYSINNSNPLNLSIFGSSLKHQFSNNYNSLASQRDHSQIIDQLKSHRSQQLLNASRNHLNLDKFSAVSPKTSLNLNCSQITPENYLQFLRMNENLSNSSNNSNSHSQIYSGQNYFNFDNSIIPGTPNSLQDRKRISRPLTGRHVRQGTGASPTTLANLRTMIKERQKFNQMGGNLCINKGKKLCKKRK